ncbi:MAG: hypothetical protein AAF685_06130 [Cyanobacteria bacterium P01_C01_bin.89]
MTDSPKQPKQRPQKIHAAATPQDCAKMGDRNGWDLLDIRPNGDRILSVDCIFDGEQTSFEDERYD